MALRKNLKSNASSKLVITSAAFQDHIMRSLLHPDFSLSDPLRRHSRGKHPQVREGVEERDLQRRHEQEEREYVLDPAPPPLTLAQKLGLVASPRERLTEDEWTRVKERSVQQEESAQPCAICREEFQLQPQVLLSCSHVFHRACLQAFERFSGRKRCPLCRREPYETRVISDATRLFQHRCATRIQAYWRGYMARKWYRTIKKTICPKDKRLRRQFFESRVIQRGVWDCPICLTALSNLSLPTVSARSNHQQRRPTVLLSCSHLFHQLCLEAFEAFSADSRPLCPLCRSAYHKKPI
ncbi:RING finger protein 32 isoform X5 [Maylandia zebra]|uniref:RING finger protein 32 isoform X5 n=1 Tax=Maylandia zebra TaxID=106582 RepID=UPI00403D2EEF